MCILNGNDSMNGINTQEEEDIMYFICTSTQEI